MSSVVNCAIIDSSSSFAVAGVAATAAFLISGIGVSFTGGLTISAGFSGLTSSALTGASLGAGAGEALAGAALASAALASAGAGAAAKDRSMPIDSRSVSIITSDTYLRTWE